MWLYFKKLFGYERRDDIFLIFYGMVLIFKTTTHGLIKLFIAAMAYYINTLDSQSSGRGRCEPNYFKVGDLF